MRLSRAAPASWVSRPVTAVLARSRAVPAALREIAGRLLRRVVDFAVVESDGRLTRELADGALTRLWRRRSRT